MNITPTAVPPVETVHILVSDRTDGKLTPTQQRLLQMYPDCAVVTVRNFRTNTTRPGLKVPQVVYESLFGRN